MKYDARQKAILDYNQLMRESNERGRKEGRAEGRREGRAEGLAEGRKERNKEIVLNLFARGFDTDFIVQITGLTAEEVEKMRT